MHRQRQSRWADLPQELVLSIIQKLIEAAGNNFSAVSNLRSVCKAWRAASSQFPAALYCTQMEDLSSLCAVFPQLAALQIPASACCHRDLRPLRTCTQLTRLTFGEDFYSQLWSNKPFTVHLRYLPSSLKELSLANIIPASNSLRNLRNVTQLSCWAIVGSERALKALLPELPGLRVSCTLCHPFEVLYYAATALAITPCTHCDLLCILSLLQ